MSSRVPLQHPKNRNGNRSLSSKRVVILLIINQKRLSSAGCGSHGTRKNGHREQSQKTLVLWRACSLQPVHGVVVRSPTCVQHLEQARCLARPPPPQRALKAPRRGPQSQEGMVHLPAVPGQPLPCSDDDDDAPRTLDLLTQNSF